MPHFLDFAADWSDPDLPSSFDETPLWSARFGILLLDHLALRPNLRILDTACGAGFPLFALANAFGPTCRLTGLDSSPSWLARARWKLTRYDLPNVELVEGDAAHMPFPDAEFDLVTCNLGINNFDDVHAVIGEWLRVMKPGATLALTTNVTGHMREFYEVFRAVLVDQGKTRFMDALKAQEAHRLSRESISQMLEQAGFVMAAAVEDAFAMRFVDGTAFFEDHLIRYGFLDGWRSILPPEEHRPVFLEIERRLNALAAHTGELRLTIPMLVLEARKPT